MIMVSARKKKSKEKSLAPSYSLLVKTKETPLTPQPFLHIFKKNFTLAALEQPLDHSFYSLVKLTTEQRAWKLTLHFSNYFGSCMSFIFYVRTFFIKYVLTTAKLRCTFIVFRNKCKFSTLDFRFDFLLSTFLYGIFRIKHLKTCKHSAFSKV